MSLRLWLRASHDHQRHRKSPAKVEGRNFDIRKNLLEYDDVANDQPDVVYYAQRNICWLPMMSAKPSPICVLRS